MFTKKGGIWSREDRGKFDKGRRTEKYKKKVEKNQEKRKAKQDSLPLAPTSSTNILKENEPHESSIRHNKGFSLFGFYFIKPYDYVYGWYALKETKHKNIVMNKYKIETV
jgi:hypothetical protein